MIVKQLLTYGKCIWSSLPYDLQGLAARRAAVSVPRAPSRTGGSAALGLESPSNAEAHIIFCIKL